MTETAITRTASARIPTGHGEFQLYHYNDSESGLEHLALVLGALEDQEDVLVRVHSECFTGDVLGSLRCDCGEQLQTAMQLIAEAGHGVVIYLRQEGRGIGLSEKLRAYNLQDQGYDTVEANLLLGHAADARTYDVAATILADIGIRSLRLLTNNPAKIDSLEALGILVNERVPIPPSIQVENAAYLKTKVERMQHMLTLPPSSLSTDPDISPEGFCTTSQETEMAKNAHFVKGQNFSGERYQANGSAASKMLGHDTRTEAKPVSAICPDVVLQLAELRERIECHHQTKSHAGSQTSRPFVTLSYAQSLDGSIAAVPGQQLALSSPESFVVTHALRAQHQAILVGIGTVLADNPRLNVRLVDGPNPHPIVVDSNLRLPADAAMFTQHKSVFVASASVKLDRQAALESAGASVVHTPDTESTLVDLAALLDELGTRGVKSVMVEGGAAILNSFLVQALADYVVLTIAPTFVGGLRALSAQYEDDTTTMAPSPRIFEPNYTQVGPDMLIWGSLKE